MGVKIPRPRYLDPHPVFLTDCVISYQNRLKRNNYFAKLFWFYNCSIEDFNASEAQVWVGAKIPRQRYLDSHSVFLTHCTIGYQDRLKKANIKGTLTLLNYFCFTIAQLGILRLQNYKSGWGSRYPGHGILTQATVSWHPPCIPDRLYD